MPAGRPRITTPSKEKCIELGIDLVKWATEKTDEVRTSFCFWYSLKHNIILTEWKLLKQKDEFRPYYEKARSALARKLHENALEKGLCHRYIRMYDQEMAQQEDEDKIFDSNLKKEEISIKGSAEAINGLNKLAQLIGKSSEDSNLRNSNNNNNKD